MAQLRPFGSSSVEACNLFRRGPEEDDDVASDGAAR